MGDDASAVLGVRDTLRGFCVSIYTYIYICSKYYENPYENQLCTHISPVGIRQLRRFSLYIYTYIHLKLEFTCRSEHSFSNAGLSQEFLLQGYTCPFLDLPISVSLRKGHTMLMRQV